MQECMDYVQVWGKHSTATHWTFSGNQSTHGNMVYLLNTREGRYNSTTLQQQNVCTTHIYECIHVWSSNFPAAEVFLTLLTLTTILHTLWVDSWEQQQDIINKVKKINTHSLRESIVGVTIPMWDHTHRLVHIKNRYGNHTWLCWCRGG